MQVSGPGLGVSNGPTDRNGCREFSDVMRDVTRDVT